MKILLLLVLSFLLLVVRAESMPCIVISKTGTVPTYTGYTALMTALSNSFDKNRNNPLLSSTYPLYNDYANFSAVTAAGENAVGYINNATIMVMTVLSEFVNATVSANSSLDQLNELQSMIDQTVSNFTAVNKSAPGVPPFIITGMATAFTIISSALTNLSTIMVQPSLNYGVNLPVSIIMRSAVNAANITSILNIITNAVNVFVNSAANVTAQLNVIVSANAPIETVAIAMQTQFNNVSNLIDSLSYNYINALYYTTYIFTYNQISSSFNSVFNAFPVMLRYDKDFISIRTSISTVLNKIWYLHYGYVYNYLYSYQGSQTNEMQNHYSNVSGLFTTIRQMIYESYLGQNVIQPSNPKNLTCGEQFAGNFSRIFNDNGSSIVFTSHYDLVNASMASISTYLDTIAKSFVTDMGVVASVLRSCVGARNGEMDCIQTINGTLDLMSDLLYKSSQRITEVLTQYPTFALNIGRINNMELIKAINNTYSGPINDFLSCSGMTMPSSE